MIYKLGELLNSWKKETSQLDKVVGIDLYGQSKTRRDFLKACADWYEAFSQQREPHWALYMQNSYEFACALFGAWQAKKTIFLPADIQTATVTRLQKYVAGFAGDVEIDKVLNLKYPITHSPTSEFAELTPEHLGIVVFTSGTTGEPCAINKHLHQCDAELASLENLWGAQLSDAHICATVSHQHIYGLLFKVLWPLCASRPFVSQRFAFPEDLYAYLNRTSHHHALVASPAHLKRLPEHLDWLQVHQKITAVFSSGGPLPERALPSILQVFGQPAIEVLGSSETGGIAHRTRLKGDESWQPLPGVAVRMRKDYLEIKSSHLHDEEWFTTQDRIVMEKNGGFKLLGRGDRIVKIEEKRISLETLEKCLVDTGLLIEACVCVLPSIRTTLAVVGVPSEAAKNILLTQNGKRTLNNKLKNFLIEEIEACALPRHWRYVDAIPCNSQGKTTHELLLELFAPLNNE